MSMMEDDGNPAQAMAAEMAAVVAGHADRMHEIMDRYTAGGPTAPADDEPDADDL
jgi:hypothetical protein